MVFKFSTNKSPAQENSKNFDAEHVEDFYEVLDVARDATEQEIKESYKKLALKHHPDRNMGNVKATEEFKTISIAYSVLSDPNKRRQYDLSGPSISLNDFEGVNMNEIGGPERFVSALFSRMGLLTLATTITPKVLAEAKDICTGNADFSKVKVRQLEPGCAITDCVQKQHAHFFVIHMDERFARNGVIIRCKSSSGSKFKLVLFERSGGVRQIRESQKKGGSTTSAEIFFVPFQRVYIGEISPVQIMMHDKDAPPAFHFLDSLQTEGAHSLENRNHIIMVYGDNFYQTAKYKLSFLPLNEACTSIVREIQDVEPMLKDKKREMAAFKKEYMDLKRKYEAASFKVKNEEHHIVELLQHRNAVYDDLYKECALPYVSLAIPDKKRTGIRSIFTFFGSKK
jgi:DnaJ-domain-containing protein 1